MRACVLTADVPGAAGAGETATGFARLAAALPASLYGIRRRGELHSSSCPDGITCVAREDAFAVMRRDGCGLYLTHDWRSPLHDLLNARDLSRCRNTCG
jgi:hypothetical protein